ncbi:MAG: hypothetical protein HY695_07515 [Deltaproteobacteria bacterium]|nr:hypothetical protein [Deltaproteobacteria bacterium]
MGEELKKEVVITLEVESGKLVSIEPRNGARITGEVAAEELGKIYGSTQGFKFIGLLLHAESSPGCVYWINGIPIRIC